VQTCALPICETPQEGCCPGGPSGRDFTGGQAAGAGDARPADGGVSCPRREGPAGRQQCAGRSAEEAGGQVRQSSYLSSEQGGAGAGCPSSTAGRESGRCSAE